jgi:hypothetical protein
VGYGKNSISMVRIQRGGILKKSWELSFNVLFLIKFKKTESDNL